METNKLIKIVGQRWSLIEKLYEKDYYVTELATALEKRPPEVSKQLHELEEAKLAGFTQKNGERRKTYSLTALGREAVELAQKLERAEPTPVKLTEPDRKYWEDLRTKLSSKSRWVAKAALQDLTILCHSTRVWKLGDDLWQYLIEQFNTNGNHNMGKIADCINIIFQNASVAKEKQITKKINELFSERLADLIGADRHKYEGSAVSTAFDCLRTMLTNAEMLKLIQEKYEKAFKSDERFGRISDLLIGELKKLYETNASEIREWLYKQMEDSDPKTAEEAYSLYQDLLKSP